MPLIPVLRAAAASDVCLVWCAAAVPLTAVSWRLARAAEADMAAAPPLPALLSNSVTCGGDARLVVRHRLGRPWIKQCCVCLHSPELCFRQSEGSLQACELSVR